MADIVPEYLWSYLGKQLLNHNWFSGVVQESAEPPWSLVPESRATVPSMGVAEGDNNYYIVFP